MDIVRGIVMVLMALDHVRVYSALPAGGPELGIFFTRLVTHFCAPAFVFLAGTSAYLSGQRTGDVGRLCRYLVTRGAWMILLEFTIIRVAWSFNLDYAHFVMAGVIWAIGCAMIILAALVRLPIAAIAAVGLAIVAGHNVLDFFRPQLLEMLREGSFGWALNILYFAFTGGTSIKLGSWGPNLVVLYSIVPWAGVMALGYAFGRILQLEPRARDKACFILGLGAIAAFVLLRALDVYGDPSPWRSQLQPNHWAGSGDPGVMASVSTALLAFLNTTKYPASLLFLLMTLGPTVAAMPVLEKAHGRAARIFEQFGRVPLFYYVIHIPLIHVAAIVVSLIRSGAVSPWLFANHPMEETAPPVGYTWGLPLLYAVTIAVVAVLFFCCRWLDEAKQRRGGGMSDASDPNTTPAAPGGEKVNTRVRAGFR